jgi:hypothetical protein
MTCSSPLNTATAGCPVIVCGIGPPFQPSRYQLSNSAWSYDLRVAISMVARVGENTLVAVGTSYCVAPPGTPPAKQLFVLVRTCAPEAPRSKASRSRYGAVLAGRSRSAAAVSPPGWYACS